MGERRHALRKKYFDAQFVHLVKVHRWCEEAIFFGKSFQG